MRMPHEVTNDFPTTPHPLSLWPGCPFRHNHRQSCVPSLCRTSALPLPVAGGGSSPKPLAATADGVKASLWFILGHSACQAIFFAHFANNCATFVLLSWLPSMMARQFDMPVGYARIKLVVMTMPWELGSLLVAIYKRGMAWQCPPTFSYSSHSLLRLLPIRLVICSHVRSLSVTFLPYMCASVAGLTAAGVADKMIAGGGVQRLPFCVLAHATQLSTPVRNGGWSAPW
jgi:hypothetical protein